MVCPRIWEYPKASVELCGEHDRDEIVMQFSNKSTATLNCQIGYRIDSTNDEQVVKLHQQVEGDDEKIWAKVRTTLQTISQCVASQYSPSESVEKFPQFAKEISEAIIHEKSLLTEGIDVVSFTCAGLPKYDQETVKQFAKQKDADLSKRLAEAEKIKLEAEKLRVEAEFQRQIATQKGEAEAQMAKDVQSAEREKKLAEIEAQKQVEVAKLEKEKASIEVEKQKAVAKTEAEKLREVAEIQKQTEALKLEAVKLQSEQKVAEAEARKVAIEKSGAITELQQAQLDLELGIAKCKWESIGKAIAGVKLPQMVTVGGGDGKGAGSAFEQLVQLMALEKLDAREASSGKAAAVVAKPGK